MTLEFRERKSKHGRKKVREVEVIRTRLGTSIVAAVIRPELNEFEPRAFEKFSAEDLGPIWSMLTAAKVGAKKRG